jgi:rhamnose utilization protein RhaD (predicted bifunctional aldolase and dehydrogenase)
VDPVSLIVAALAAGASAAFQDAARQVVKDAYAGLKSLLRHNLADEPEALSVIEQHEEAPEVWEKSLERELGRTGVADDEAVVRAAQRLLAAIDPEGARAGKYNVTISGGKGIVVGDHAQVGMRFDDGA